MPAWVALPSAESDALAADDRVLTHADFNNVTARRYGVSCSGLLHPDKLVTAPKSTRRNHYEALRHLPSPELC